MKPLLARIGLGAVLAIALTGTGRSGSPSPDMHGPDMQGFHQQMDRDMQTMMRAMDAAPITGNADVDFAAMMIPHHQGAIDMAQSELRYGRNEPLRRIAQGIIVEQQQEIAAMHLALDPPLRLPSAWPTQGAICSTAAPSLTINQPTY